MNQKPCDPAGIQPTPKPDDLDERLVAYDEQLRHGAVPNSSDLTVTGRETDPEESSLISCLHLLERAWPRTSPENSPGPSNQIGRFRLEKILGVGGFGIVYKAYDPLLRREIALKVPRLHSLANDSLRERFDKEARAAASLDHPNIVPIHETGQIGPICFIAAAFCAGPNLAEWLKAQKSPMSVRVAVRLIYKLAMAVHYSHSRGILHRDIKPSNVMLVPIETTGEESMPVEFPFVPRLTDFGLAKVLEGKLDQLAENAETMALGTPAYMAPEQTGKLGLPIGPATDVYGLGVILYELLTGRPPFLATNPADLFDLIRNSDPVGPHSLRREISRDLETICLRCLEKNPAKRFATAKDLADDLERLRRGEPIASRPASLLDRLLRWCRRKPTTAALIGVSALSLVAIVGQLVSHNRVLTQYNAHVSTLNDDLSLAASHARILQNIAEKNEKQAKDYLYAADINRAATAWKQNDSSVLNELLDRHIPLPGETDRRGFEWWFLHQQGHREHRVLLDVKSAIYIIRMAPDQRLMAAAGFDATVRLFDSQTGRISQEIHTGQVEVNGLAFSPDGRELATAGDDGTVRFWNLETGSERLKINAHPQKAFQLLYTPDGSQVISCGDNPMIRMHDAQTGAERGQFLGHTNDVQSLLFTADNTMFASTGSDHFVKVWNLKSGSVVLSFEHLNRVGPVALRQDQAIVGTIMGDLLTIRISNGQKLAEVKDLDGIDSLAIHPNGELLATGNGGGAIRLWNLGPDGQITENSLLPWQAHRGSVVSLIWTDDGSRLISAGSDGRVTSWGQLTSTPNNPRQIEIEKLTHVHRIPNTDRLIVAKDTPFPPVTRVLDWQTGAEVSQRYGDGFGEFAISPDGRFIAGVTGQVNQEVHDIPEVLRLLEIQDLADGSTVLRNLAQWESPGQLRGVKFSPDSKQIAVSQWHRPRPEQLEEHFVILFDMPDLTFKETIPVPYAKVATFSPDNQHVALGTRAGITFWNLNEHRIVWEVPQRNLSFLSFSPDGSLFATGGDDRLVVVRNSDNGSLRFQLAGHRALLRALAFSPDGRTLATADHVGYLKFWSVSVGQELFELNNNRPTWGDFEFSEDGQFLIFKAGEVPEFGDKLDRILIFDASHR